MGALRADSLWQIKLLNKSSYKFDTQKLQYKPEAIERARSLAFALGGQSGPSCCRSLGIQTMYAHDSTFSSTTSEGLVQVQFVGLK